MLLSLFLPEWLSKHKVKSGFATYQKAFRPVSYFDCASSRASWGLFITPSSVLSSRSAVPSPAAFVHSVESPSRVAAAQKVLHLNFRNTTTVNTTEGYRKTDLCRYIKLLLIPVYFGDIFT